MQKIKQWKEIRIMIYGYAVMRSGDTMVVTK